MRCLKKAVRRLTIINRDESLIELWSGVNRRSKAVLVPRRHGEYHVIRAGRLRRVTGKWLSVDGETRDFILGDEYPIEIEIVEPGMNTREGQSAS